MKVVGVSYTDGPGGAGVAVRRIFSGLVKEFGHDNFFTLRVARASSPQSFVRAGYGSGQNFAGRLLREVRFAKARLKRLAYRTLGGVGVFSEARIRTGFLDDLVENPPDVLIVNWIGDFTVSLEEIQKIDAPLVVRLADHWLVEAPRHFDYRKPGSQSASDWNQWLEAVFYARAKLRLEPRIRSFMSNVSVLVYPGAEPPNSLCELAAKFGIQIVTIPNPVSRSLSTMFGKSAARTIFGMGQKSLVLGFGGDRADCDPRKGLQVLVDALHMVGKRGGIPDDGLELHVFGSNRRETVEHGPFRISYHKWLDPYELSKFFEALDVLISPSLEETFGNLILEAQTNGCPVVATKVGGSSAQIVDGRTGFLVEPNNSVALADKILQVISCRKDLPLFGDRARNHVLKRFSERAVAAMYLELFSSVKRDYAPKKGQESA